MKEITTTKEMFEHVLKTLKEQGSGFICTIIKDCHWSYPLAKDQTIQDAITYLQENYPSETLHKETFDSEYFYRKGKDEKLCQFAWWKIPKETREHLHAMEIKADQEIEMYKFAYEVERAHVFLDRLIFVEKLLTQLK